MRPEPSNSADRVLDLRYALDRRRVTLFALLVASGSGLTPTAQADETETSLPITHFPAVTSPGCRNGAAKLFDECGSQVKIFEAALTESRRSKRVLIVSYGAEWCIWCRVFDAYVAGQVGQFEYRLEDGRARFNEFASEAMRKDAINLNRLVSEGFVIAHIENRFSADGEAVLDRTGAVNHFDGRIPFVFSVTPAGKFAATFNGDIAEVRREGADWY
jgi:hypothetical protein